MKKIKSIYSTLYILAHNIKKSIQLGKPVLNIFKQFPQYFYYMNVKNPMDLGLPWITIAAVNEINKYIYSEMKIFEYGSGGSTIFFAKRVKEVVSVEHHKEWYDVVMEQLQAKSLSNVYLQLIEPDKAIDNDSARYKSIWKREYEGFDFYNYVHFIDQYDEEYFDVILIDGRARSHCLESSISKLKKGGMLVFDNADRNIYHDAISKNLKDWPVSRNYGPTIGDVAFSETHIFYKPLSTDNGKSN